MNDLYCPLIESNVDPIDCLENIDIIDGFISDESHIPDKFKAKGNWKEICKSCKDHVSTVG